VLNFVVLASFGGLFGVCFILYLWWLDCVLFSLVVW